MESDPAEDNNFKRYREAQLLTSLPVFHVRASITPVRFVEPKNVGEDHACHEKLPRVSLAI